MRTFTAVIERCPDTGFYVGYVRGFPGAHSQAESLEELNGNLKEVIELQLEETVKACRMARSVTGEGIASAKDRQGHRIIGARVSETK